MINNISILFSLLIVGYVVVRAVLLDSRRPWFEIEPVLGPAPVPEVKRRNVGMRGQS